MPITSAKVKGGPRKPAEMLGMYDWATLENMRDHATVFAYTDNVQGKVFYDAFGSSVTPEKLFVPKAIVTGGRWEALTG